MSFNTLRRADGDPHDRHWTRLTDRLHRGDPDAQHHVAWQGYTRAWLAYA